MARSLDPVNIGSHHFSKKLFLYIHKIAPITVTASTIKPTQPLRLS